MASKRAGSAWWPRQIPYLLRFTALCTVANSGVPRCGTNPQNQTMCGDASQCSIPSDSPLTPFNETAMVNQSLGYRGCNDYVG